MYAIYKTCTASMLLNESAFRISCYRQLWHVPKQHAYSGLLHHDSAGTGTQHRDPFTPN